MWARGAAGPSLQFCEARPLDQVSGAFPGSAERSEAGEVTCTGHLAALSRAGVEKE